MEESPTVEETLTNLICSGFTELRMPNIDWMPNTGSVHIMNVHNQNKNHRLHVYGSIDQVQNRLLVVDFSNLPKKIECVNQGMICTILVQGNPLDDVARLVCLFFKYPTIKTMLPSKLTKSVSFNRYGLYRLQMFMNTMVQTTKIWYDDNIKLNARLSNLDSKGTISICNPIPRVEDIKFLTVRWLDEVVQIQLTLFNKDFPFIYIAHNYLNEPSLYLSLVSLINEQFDVAVNPQSINPRNQLHWHCLSRLTDILESRLSISNPPTTS